MLLEVKNLGIAYGDKPPIVQGVTFNLDKGEILATSWYSSLKCIHVDVNTYIHG